MKLQSNPVNPQQGRGVDPFAALAEQGKQPAGPGTGANRLDIVTGASGKRRRIGNQVLGDTPPRDGPFAMSAKPIAVAFPPKARREVRRKITQSGANPFK